MVRVTNVDNSEKLDDARAVIMPQGQHIGISETTYKELNKALGKKSEKMNLSADGKEIYIIYQQDKSTKAHPTGLPEFEKRAVPAHRTADRILWIS